jgi:hypothetical protein
VRVPGGRRGCGQPSTGRQTSGRGAGGRGEVYLSRPFLELDQELADPGVDVPQLKNSSLRSRARIQRETCKTPFSPFALTRAEITATPRIWVGSASWSCRATKSSVTTPCRYEPALNRTYQAAPDWYGAPLPVRWPACETGCSEGISRGPSTPRSTAWYAGTGATACPGRRGARSRGASNHAWRSGCRLRSSVRPPAAP